MLIDGPNGMMLHATLESHDPADDRSATRKRLRLATSRLRTGRDARDVVIHDLSADGMLLESAERLADGDGLTIELPGSGNHSARVVWSSGAFYGCRFAKTLSSAALSAALLKASPPDGAGSRDRAPVDLPFPERVTALRQERGWSVEQLARRLGISRQSVWYWECGKRTPKPAMLARIEETFGLGVGNLARPSADRVDHGELALWKARIAARLGVAAEKVKILIEL
jgi:transcriptional regulator with XRE-family HTH domain